MTTPISKSNAAHYQWGGDCDGWRLVDGVALSVIHERMPPGRREVRHMHALSRQFFFVLTGELTLEVGGAFHVLGPGVGFEIAPRTVHQAINDRGSAVEFLVISQPPTTGDLQPA